ncbi:MAG: PepSY-associated TM helix domain-containing protein [Bacteroidota bacterium]
MENNKRDYNVFFNTHTVSGIAISVGLFVCFFAGAFALFLDDINYWQVAKKQEAYRTDIDYEKALALVEAEGYKMEGRDFFLMLRDATEDYIQVSSQALKVPQDSTKEAFKLSPEDSLAHANFFIKIDPDKYVVTARKFEAQHLLGSFLYHLHYYRQIPAVGIYIAGTVSLFFLFAIFTGVIIHWKKIISYFFTFRLKGSIKNLWTDGHTALGMIGLPFQFMYAVTGAFFGLSILLYIPFVAVMFDGDVDKALALLRPGVVTEEVAAVGDKTTLGINDLVNKSLVDIDQDEIEYVRLQVRNYGNEAAQLVVSAQMDTEREFMGLTRTTFRLHDGAVLDHKPLDEITYTEAAPIVLGKLHFASFGGHLMKLVYFVLALLTCFVILSGVMIWIEARDTKAYAHKATFNKNVGAIYLGLCLGMFPAIALFFCLVKLFPTANFDVLSGIFFAAWLGYTVYAYKIKSNFKINKHALLLAGSLGLIIPVLNGIQSGIWVWQALPMGYFELFVVDFGWLTLGTLSLLAGIYAKPLDKKRKPRRRKEKVVPATATEDKLKEQLEGAVVSFGWRRLFRGK